MKLPLIIIIGFGCIFYSCNTNNYNYRVKNYNLTLSPRIDNKDIDVTLELTYIVDGTGEKSDGPSGRA